MFFFNSEHICVTEAVFKEKRRGPLLKNSLKS